MKGLLVKDMRILLRMKTSMIVILALGIFMSLSGDTPVIGLGYMMAISTIFATNTISYDYFEKGMNFMFTLPVRRRDYVMEKYLFAFLSALVMVIVTAIIQVAISLAGGAADWELFFETVLGSFIAASLLMAAYIPVTLKFGPEKSRIVLLILFGGIAGVSYVGYKLVPLQRVLMIAEAFGRMSTAQIAGIGVVLWVLVMLVSVGISIKIMEKKEF